MTPVQQLIQAIQSCSCEQLRQVICNLEEESDQEVRRMQKGDRLWARRSKIDDRMPGLGLTALYVAAKAYSAHSQDPKLAQVFDQMVASLLVAGASPFVAIGATYRTRMVPVMSKHSDPEIGTFLGGQKLGEREETIVVNPGRTVVEVCEGKLPPSLVNWFAANINDNMKSAGPDHVQVHTTTKAREAAEADKRRGGKAKNTVANRANLVAIRKRLAREGVFSQVGFALA